MIDLVIVLCLCCLVLAALAYAGWLYVKKSVSASPAPSSPAPSSPAPSSPASPSPVGSAPSPVPSPVSTPVPATSVPSPSPSPIGSVPAPSSLAPSASVPSPSPIGSAPSSLPSVASSSWKTGAWSGCSAQCGDGIKTREVWCESGATGQRIPKDQEWNYCTIATQPSPTEPCKGTTCGSAESYTLNVQRGLCVGEDVHGACNTGTQFPGVRGVVSTCVDSKGQRVDLAKCGSNLEGNSVESCQRPCPPKPPEGTTRWNVGYWNGCIGSNGEQLVGKFRSMCEWLPYAPIERRSVTCEKVTDGRWVQTSDSECRETKPADTKKCYIPPVCNGPIPPGATGWDSRTGQFTYG